MKRQGGNTMIVRWKKVDPLLWVSETWRGRQTAVYWDVTAHKWKTMVCAQPGYVFNLNNTTKVVVAQSWPTAKAAINAVDQAMERFIQKAMAGAVEARQRTPEVAHA
jgi:hypothetical protein